MSSFRFNFSNNKEIPEDQTEHDQTNWIECEQISSDLISSYNINNLMLHTKTFLCGGLEIKQVATNEVMKNMQLIQGDIQFAESNLSDLMPGKYEGGLKIWECTIDLLKYLMDEVEHSSWKQASVLDLGCGAGLLGIYAFINGSNVTFQDYNKEVLENATIPNVLLNVKEKENISLVIDKCKFYSGDWESFNKLLGEQVNYDFILTSETIYNENNYNKIIDILIHKLSDKGVAFIAAKTHYFGVGGGVSQFESCLRKNDIFDIEVCWKTVNGIQREILKVTKKKIKINI